MNLEGRLRLSLECAEGHIRAARVDSERPVFAGRILEGRRTGVALAAVALLFSLCGRAQTVALAGAIEAAQAREPSPAVCCQRQAMVTAEAAREHLWRLAVDLPQHAGTVPQAGTLAQLRRLFEQTRVASGGAELWWAQPLNAAAAVAWLQLADALEDLLANKLFGEGLDTWRGRESLAALDTWLTAQATPLAQQLAVILAQDFADVRLPLVTLTEAETSRGEWLGLEGFARQPSFHGQPAETGALARQRAAPLVQDWLAQRGASAGLRILARLAELAQMPETLRRLAGGEPQARQTRTWSAGAVGLGAVETARGLLLHQVQLADDVLAHLTIVAPTEWNFHPQGAWVQGLVGTPAASREDAKARGAFLTFALDPCVAWTLEVHNA